MPQHHLLRKTLHGRVQIFYLSLFAASAASAALLVANEVPSQALTGTQDFRWAAEPCSW